MSAGPRNSSRVLLVEGSDDHHFLAPVVNSLFGDRQVRVVSAGGVDNLLAKKFLQAQLAQSDLERLGIVVDADARPGARWLALRSRLAALRCVLPEFPPAESCVVAYENLKVGVWMMPTNRGRGTLEHLLLKLVPQGDDLLPRAVGAVRSIPVASRRFRGSGVRKAMIRTWLAWQEDPGPPFGTAWSRRVFDQDAPALAPFKAWLTDLFE